MIRGVFLPVILFILLTNCHSRESVTQVRELSYKPEVIILKAHDIEIIDRTEITYEGGGYIPPIHPKTAMMEWVGRRLRAGSDSGKVEVIIKEASFKEEPILLNNKKHPRRGGITKYDAKYLIGMKLYRDGTRVGRTPFTSKDDFTNKVAEINIEAFSTRTVEGVLSIPDKDRLVLEMVQELLNNADRQLQENILLYFTGN